MRFDFFKTFISNPKTTGSVVPSSKFLSKAITNLSYGPIIVEIGAGTGALTEGLIEKFGYENLYIIEIDDSLVKILTQKFPKAKVFQGSASELEKILPHTILKKVNTIVSGIPLRNLNETEKKDILDACAKILAPQGQILQFTYGFTSPIPFQKWGFNGKRVEYIFRNAPPAFVWKFIVNTSYQSKPLAKKPLNSIPIIWNEIRRRCYHQLFFSCAFSPIFAGCFTSVLRLA